MLGKRNRAKTHFKSNVVQCTFLNECYFCLSQGLLGKREFLPQAECLRRLIVPVCSHLPFARLCRNIFFSLGGYNMKNIDMVCTGHTRQDITALLLRRALGIIPSKQSCSTATLQSALCQTSPRALSPVCTVTAGLIRGPQYDDTPWKRK